MLISDLVSFPAAGINAPVIPDGAMLNIAAYIAVM
jgi:hypothetical protein